MSLLLKGITKISELDIDVDKDMVVHGLFNLKEVVAGMLRGDIAVKNTNQLVIVPAGPTDFVLTSTGQGKLPVWAPAGGGLKYYFPVVIGLTDAEAIVVVDKSHNEDAPLITSHAEAYDDQPALYIRQLTPTIASVDAEAIVAVAASHNTNSRLGTDLSILVDGFVEETAAGVQTDHTVEARSGAAGDLNLCPMVPTVLDKIYVGSNYPFWRVWMNYSQAGSGNWTNVAYYWNGAWVACVGEDDQTSSFTAAAGIKRIDHTPQGDWGLSVIQAMNLYWMMIRTDNFVNQVAKPLGSQIFVSIS